jgi:mannose/fructose/N-acetylgalactosamine-specific phosphotransferase system component IIC
VGEGAVDTPILTRDFLAIIVLGGVLAIDDRAGWQGLIAQPLFAALLVGAVVGGVEHALVVGLAMELVWLAILPMRGARRPDSVAGAMVGAGTACILLQHTADVRVGFIVGTSAFAGLVVGELSGWGMRALGRFRALRLGRFSPSEIGGLRAVSRRLDAYQLAALAYLFFLEAGVIAVALPVTMVAVALFTGAVDDPFAAGARWWLDLLPAIGAAAMIQHFWHRQANRFLVVAALVVAVVLWIR